MERGATLLAALLMAVAGCGDAGAPGAGGTPSPTERPAPGESAEPSSAPVPSSPPEQQDGTASEDCEPVSRDGGGRPRDPDTDSTPDDSATVRAFLDAALAQRGDPYVFGVEVDLEDADPRAFDDSELVQWTAHQAGITVPDGSFHQYLELKSQGRLVSVTEGLATPGALLFSFSSEPTAGGGRPAQGHVAISLGDGRTIEARSTHGVSELPAGDRFQYAGVLPALAAAEPARASRSAPVARGGSAGLPAMRLSIREIYEVALAAGFSPAAATIWTAIALAESGGETGAINSVGEHSVGLWQINVAPGVRRNTWGDLRDPLVNARAAYEISCRGTDLRPWPSTHPANAGTVGDYRTHLDEVRRAVPEALDGAVDSDGDGLSDAFERLMNGSDGP